MILRSPTEDENADFVMPAWIAGIQARKDASGDIHVSLDSITPCWNDAIETTLLKLTEFHVAPVFKGEHEKNFFVQRTRRTQRILEKKSRNLARFALLARGML
jgi:hypothetical protein